MKTTWLLMLVLSLFVAGCGGDTSPVNEGKDRPTPPPKKDK